MNYERQMTDFLMAISFSIFGMLLIFGLGFIFPAMNPYIVIKWIIIVCAVVFVYAFLAYLFGALKTIKRFKKGSKK